MRILNLGEQIREIHFSRNAVFRPQLHRLPNRPVSRRSTRNT
jgi:hypothetical protein